MVDRESVLWTYRLLLGREPENEQVVQAHCQAPDRATLVRSALGSPEFMLKNPTPIKLSGRDVWVEIADDVLLKVNLADDFGVSGPVIMGSFEPSETEFVRRNVSPGSVCADIGANLGYFTMIMASLAGDIGTVLSFEPNPNIIPYLRASAKLNGFSNNIRQYELGLSDRPGRVWLQFAQHTNNWGGATLNFGPQTLEGHVNVEVALDVFDHVAGDLSRLDFIKIDVEGAEFLAMQGAAETLTRLKPTILSEIHVAQLRRVSNVSGEEYIALMQGFSYHCFELLENGKISDRSIVRPSRELANVAFLHSERAAS